MGAGMTIGEFAVLTHLNVRTLRHYHETGVLEPAEVDAATGYRYYTGDQIPTAQVVFRLRELDLPLPQIREILGTGDPELRAGLVAAHLERLEAELDRTRAAVRALHRLLRPEATDPSMELRSVPARTVAFVTGTVRADEVLSWYDAAMAELDAAVEPARRQGPPAGRYANELFTGGDGTATVFYPVDPRDGAVASTGRVETRTLPAVELAVAVHHGDHDTIAETYGLLGRWVVDHALSVDGPVHETYLVGPRDTPVEHEWRTEIGWPIFRVSNGDAAPRGS